MDKQIFESYFLRFQEGDLSILTDLGDCYYYGRGVNTDHKMAVKYYQMDINNPISVYNLGYCYQFGFGVEQNVRKAVEYYQLSADKGYIKAYGTLGDFYDAYHIGIAKNSIKSLNYYQLGADKGDLYCLRAMSDYYFNGDLRNYKKSFEYAQLCADKGDLSANNRLGHLYEYGRGVPQDLKKALELYNNPTLIKDCELKLLEEYNKSLTRNDYVDAYYLYKKYHYAGDAHRKTCHLGVMYRLLYLEYTTEIKNITPVLRDIMISYLL